jgi:hypothetical protein
MLTDTIALCPRLRDVLDRVEVRPGGLSAHTAGETYEEDDAATLARTLGALLYQTVHNGRDKPLQEAMRSFRDLTHEAALLARTPDRHREVPGRLVTEGTETVVDLDGVRVRVPASDVTPGEPGQVAVRVPCARPGLSPGFLYLYPSNGSRLGGPVLRLYAHLTGPESAPEVWAQAVDLLERLDAGWHAKVLSNRALYPRYDGLVVYLNRDGWRHAPRLAETLEATGLLGAGQSPFTRPLTSGVSCAFEPTDKRPMHAGTSFGQHRATILAQALVAHATLPDPEAQPVEELIYTAFLDADIDPEEPARNLGSPATAVLGLD